MASADKAVIISVELAKAAMKNTLDWVVQSLR